jgi:DNA repair photolyase
MYRFQQSPPDFDRHHSRQDQGRSRLSSTLPSCSSQAMPPTSSKLASIWGAPATALKGRGTAWALQHRFAAEQRVSFDDGWGGLEAAAANEPKNSVDTGAHVHPMTQVVETRVRSVLSKNDSPDISFDLSINPYRGCEHGCIYCYARPTHSYLDLSPGLDFETRIVAKVNAAERLRAALAAPAYVPRHLNLGSVTDAYQPAERRLRITRAVLQVLADTQHAFSIITKSSLVERDMDLIAPMAEQRLAAVYLSITTLSPQLARILEPRAAAPYRRLRTMEVLARQGIPVGVSVSPIIPFLNEPELERVLQAARDAGAVSAFTVVLRLPWELNPLFQQWLQQHMPDRASRIMARVRDMRGGQDNDSRFGSRMRGQGPWAELLRQRFEKACARLGLNRSRPELDLSRFRRPAAVAGQGELF